MPIPEMAHFLYLVSSCCHKQYLNRAQAWLFSTSLKNEYKCCITSCCPYSNRKGNLIVCRKGLCKQSLNDTLFTYYFYNNQGKDSRFGALIQSCATKNITVLWGEVPNMAVFLTLNSYSAYPGSFSFDLFLHSM